MRSRKALSSGLFVLFSMGMLPGASLRVSVLDTETGEPLAARAYLWCDGKPLIPPGRMSYQRGSELHFLLTGTDLLELEGAECRLRVERGLEYEPVEVSFGADRDTFEIRLRRWAAMNDSGWYSADMHVHRDPRELPAILLAEDLNFAPTITTHVWSEQVSHTFPAAREFPVQVDTRHFFTANSQEVERIQGGPGAVILLAKELPIPFEGYEAYPPAIHYTSKVHAQGGYVEGDKPFWLDTYVNVALGELDFIELNCNHFLPRDVDTDLVPWSHWPTELGYFGDREFAHWMMDSYYRLLSCGFRLPLSAGSASGVKATPVGYDRIYVYLGEATLNYENLLRAMKEGRSFTTNGPLLDLRINGEIGPGSTQALEKGEKVRVEARVRSRTGLEVAELIVNGKVFKSYPARGRRDLEIREEFVPAESSWMALRAFEPAEETIVFGHTSPAYLLVEGHPIASPEAARFLMARIDELIEYTVRKVVFREARHREETIQLYRQARSIYERIALGRPEP